MFYAHVIISAERIFTRQWMLPADSAFYPAQAIITRGFAVLWCLITAVNMLIGVIKAGYGWGEELTIFLVIFAMPVVPLLWIAER